MININSLKSKITIFFLILTSIYFLINLAITLNYINNEKREDLQILLSHALSESYDYIKKYQDKTNLSFLYDIPHMTSVLEKSGARDIKFFFSAEKYHPKDNEIAVFKQLRNGTYFNLKSNDSVVKKHIIDTAITMIFQHLAYLVIIGILGIYFINKLLLPLGHLAEQSKNYKDGNEFYLNDKNIGIEIEQIKTALNMLVRRFGELRKKDKEIFAAATHELKTPLAIIKARVEKYSENHKYTKDEFIKDIDEDIKRLYLEIKSILYFNIFDFDEKVIFSVREEICGSIEKVDLLLKNYKLDVKILGDDFNLEARKNLFIKMFMSIFENAITYTKTGTTIEVYIENKTIKVKNKQGGKVNLFSSKLGIKILEKLSKELNFTFDIFKDSQDYEVIICFN